MWGQVSRGLTASRLAAVLTRALIGSIFYPTTSAESALGVTPANPYFPEGWAERYGVTIGTAADQRAKLQTCLNVCGHASGPGVAWLPPGTVRIDSGLTVPGRVWLRGLGRSVSRLNYYGAGGSALSNATPGVRIYDWQMSDFLLFDAGSGARGIDADSVSTSRFWNLEVYGFDTAARLYSPVAGFSVYNRLHDVTANQCADGFVLTGASTNANELRGCRYNGASAVAGRGFVVNDSNGNQFYGNHVDYCGTAFELTASAPGATDGNVISANRIENASTGISLGANTRYSRVGGNYFPAVTTPLVDAGTYNQIDEPASFAGPGFSRVFIYAHALGSALLERVVSGGASLPLLRLVDSNSGSGTPVTLQIETERAGGTFFRCRRGAQTYIEAFADGALQARIVQPPSANRGDASVSLTVGADAYEQRFETALTADRTVTLSTVGARSGDRFRVVRTGLGAFTLAVGALKTIPAGTAAWVEVTYNGASWVLSGYGAL